VNETTDFENYWRDLFGAQDMAFIRVDGKTIPVRKSDVVIPKFFWQESRRVLIEKLEGKQ
jgi:predicted RNA-binding protein